MVQRKIGNTFTVPSWQKAGANRHELNRAMRAMGLSPLRKDEDVREGHARLLEAVREHPSRAVDYLAGERNGLPDAKERRIEIKVNGDCLRATQLVRDCLERAQGKSPIGLLYTDNWDVWVDILGIVKSLDDIKQDRKPVMRKLRELSKLVDSFDCYEDYL